MGYMIEISSEKKIELAEHAEQVLRHAGKMMQCIEEMCDEPEQRMGYRRGVKGTGRYGMRNNMGYRGSMGYREEDMEEEEPVPYEKPRPGMMGYREPYYE